ncbi:MAG: hypothetical protein MZW92_10395 [Comamonadaceae bacterium]|nr:hypothetical protein [Comamonadaceae bacterium]
MSDLFLPRGRAHRLHEGPQPGLRPGVPGHLGRPVREASAGRPDRPGQRPAPPRSSAGAVMDHDRGLVVGEDSWGKGLVQTDLPAGPGHGRGPDRGQVPDAERAVHPARLHPPRRLPRSSKRAPEDSPRGPLHGQRPQGPGPGRHHARLRGRVHLLKPYTGRAAHQRGLLRLRPASFVPHQTDLGKTFVFPRSPRTPRRPRAGKIQIGTAFVADAAVVADFREPTWRRARSPSTTRRSTTPRPRSAASSSAKIAAALWGVDEGVPRGPTRPTPWSGRPSRSMPEAARMIGK